MVVNLNASLPAPAGWKLGTCQRDGDSRVGRGGCETQVNLRTGHTRWACEMRVIIVDGDSDDPRGAVNGMDGESIGQMMAFIERLHRRIRTVERVGPHAGRGHLIGTVAVVGGRSGRRRDKGVGRVV